MAASVVEQVAGSSSNPGSSPVPGRASSPVRDQAPVRYGRARQALVDASVELAGRVGFHGMTVSELSVAAGVGPRTFYNHFADLSDVFFDACRQVHEELREAIRVAYDGAVAERGEVIAATAGEGLARGCARVCVDAVIAFVQADPPRARVLFVEGYAGGPAVAELRAETMEWLINLLCGGAERRDGTGDAGPRDPATGKVPSARSMLLAEAAVGGIGGVLSARIGSGDLDGLDDLVPSFVETLMRARPPR